MTINKVTLLGNITRDPEIRTMGSGDKMAQISVATNERWKDKNTGEKRERSEFHRVCIFDKHIVGVIENHVRKGARLYIEGQLETRSWDQNGEKKYSTEVVLRPFKGEMTIIEFAKDGNREKDGNHFQEAKAPNDSFDDDIPF